MEVGVKYLSVQILASIVRTISLSKQEYSVFWGQETSDQIAVESVEL